jgi:hypothetical protein
MPHLDTASTDTGTFVDDGAVSIFTASPIWCAMDHIRGGKMGTRLFLEVRSTSVRQLAAQLADEARLWEAPVTESGVKMD